MRVRVRVVGVGGLKDAWEYSVKERQLIKEGRGGGESNSHWRGEV